MDRVKLRVPVFLCSACRILRLVSCFELCPCVIVHLSKASVQFIADDIVSVIKSSTQCNGSLINVLKVIRREFVQVSSLDSGYHVLDFLVRQEVRVMFLYPFVHSAEVLPSGLVFFAPVHFIGGADCNRINVSKDPPCFLLEVAAHEILITLKPLQLL